MNREQLHAGLTELIPESARRECVARAMVDMDVLLDQLIILNRVEDPTWNTSVNITKLG